MTRDELRRRLQDCATEIERGIEARREGLLRENPDIPAERWVDTQGQPILAPLYAELAATYRAIADLTPKRRIGGPG